jgi:tetratricopeptide (TPR) repeat protein
MKLQAGFGALGKCFRASVSEVSDFKLSKLCAVSKLTRIARFAVILAVLSAVCSSALSQDDSAEGWYKKGIELRNNGSYAGALEAYERSTELNQSYVPAWSAKGALLSQMGKKDEAKSAFERVLGIYDEALANDSQDAYAWIERGVALVYLGRYDESIESRQKALEIFNQTIEDDPDDPQAWSNKAFALAGMGMYSESIEALDQVINLTDNSSMLLDAWRGKAVAYAEGTHEFNKSLEAWARALELMPADDTANLSVTWGCKAKTFEMAGRFEEAVEAYGNVIKLQPTNAIAWIGKGSALRSLNRSFEAEAAFDQAINVSESDYWQAWFGKGEALLDQGRYDEAVEAFDRVTEQNPTHARTWNDKGTALQAIGCTSEAEAAYARAEELGYQG